MFMHAASVPPHERDALVLLAQNPCTLFVYWRLTPLREALLLEHFGAPWRSLQPMLRFYDITGLVGFDGSQAVSLRDVALPDGGFAPGRRYAVDLGVIAAEQRFVALLRAAPVQMPVPEDGSGMAGGTGDLGDGDMARGAWGDGDCGNTAHGAWRDGNCDNMARGAWRNGGAEKDAQTADKGRFTLILPEEYKQFSAYSVYAPRLPEEGHGGDT